MSGAIGGQAFFIAPLGIQEFLFRGNVLLVQSFFPDVVPMIDLVVRLRLKEVGFLLAQFDAVQEGQDFSSLDLLAQFCFDLDDPACDARAQMHEAVLVGLDRGRGRDFVPEGAAFHLSRLKYLTGERFGRD